MLLVALVELLDLCRGSLFVTLVYPVRFVVLSKRCVVVCAAFESAASMPGRFSMLATHRAHVLDLHPIYITASSDAPIL